MTLSCLPSLASLLLTSLNYRILSTNLCSVTMLLFCYFSPAGEMLSITQVITDAIAFGNTARFSFCDWAVQNSADFVASLLFKT